MAKSCQNCQNLKVQIAELKRKLRIAREAEKHWKKLFREIDEIVVRKVG